MVARARLKLKLEFSSSGMFTTCKVIFTKHGLEKGTRQLWHMVLTDCSVRVVTFLAPRKHSTYGANLGCPLKSYRSRILSSTCGPWMSPRGHVHKVKRAKRIINTEGMRKPYHIKSRVSWKLHQAANAWSACWTSSSLRPEYREVSMDKGSLEWFNQCARPAHRPGPAGDFVCSIELRANILQLQISHPRLRGTSENVIVVFKSCLAT